MLLAAVAWTGRIGLTWERSSVLQLPARRSEKSRRSERAGSDDSNGEVGIERDWADAGNFVEQIGAVRVTQSCLRQRTPVGGSSSCTQHDANDTELELELRRRDWAVTSTDR